MTLTDQDRIAQERQHARIVDLWLALQPLKSTLRFMNTGAHPDDETTAMLTALAMRDGVNLSYACANRGEGGQNDIGTEMSEALGALRTREMERACDVLGMRLYWLSQGPGDTILDFGFSKSGVETLEKWNRDRVLQRFVQIVRAEQPDIICPTFLDIPGQHGHHRAMTEAAHDVMQAAADPGFKGCDLPVWRVSKLYLPAWSGAGQAYDDDLPPPPATLVIDGRGRDPVTGWSHARIAQHSRACHKTQGMGRWVAPGDENDWPLHLAQSRVAGPDRSLSSGLAATLRDWAALCGTRDRERLETAQTALEDAIAAFPDFDRITRYCATALTQIQGVSGASLPPGLASRLDQKSRQIGQVIALSAGVGIAALGDKTWIRAGTSLALRIEKLKGGAQALETEWVLPDGWELSGAAATPTAQAEPHDGYRAAHDPLAPAAPALRARISVHGATAEIVRAVQPAPVVLPARSVDPDPLATVLNSAVAGRALTLRLSGIHPASATPSLSLPEGWQARRNGSGFTIVAPDDVAPGLYTLPVHLDGQPANTVRRITYSHIAPTALIKPAGIDIRVVEAELDTAKVGYIGAGKDRVGHWLAALGADVTEVSDAELGSGAALDAYDTLVIGIFAFRFRPGLTDAAPGLRSWVERGGNLVTLYHRPWDNWDPATTPPRPVQIGQPSLRWRVTDQNAAVTHLHPDHPLLNRPNRIGPADWRGWHKERGLYFARSWDSVYTPLLEMADPDEAPHRGALVSARIGKGRHSHCALILHHQMEKLTPGGFRLMANLIARPR